ncbi:signal peptidase II [Zavarzinella formosa]|uniref:signal peptidase II n=1 Tax=Zavarzinella formosa TaxID=360055 RepID=UPI00038047D7|nr:signal peptidase II [Zavarzinella formosa]
MPERSYRWALFALGLLGFAADQSSKYGVFNWLYEPNRLVGSREVIPGAFRLLVQFEPESAAPSDCPLVKWNGPLPPRVNHGALFSLGGQYKADANLFFGVVSVLAAVGIAGWGLRKSTGKDRVLCLALGLILGGTTGNMFDRFVFGGVRDFLYFYLIDWPVFNVADCFLVCGAGLLLVQALFGRTKPTDTPATPTTTPPVA